MNDEDGLATHISALAAPIFGALIVRASIDEVGDPEWRKQARADAIELARELWVATLAA